MSDLGDDSANRLAIDDDEDESWIEEWEEAERNAARVVVTALTDLQGAAAPEGAMATAAAQLRAGMQSDRYPFAWIRRAAGLDGDLPENDTDLLLGALAATISPREETGLSSEEESAIIALELGDWAGAVIELGRNGPGASADPDALVEAIDDCPEVEGPPTDLEEASIGKLAFELVGLAWEATGILDDSRRLTPLGAWALPRALTRAWGVDFDSGEPLAR